MYISGLKEAQEHFLMLLYLRSKRGEARYIQESKCLSFPNQLYVLLVVVFQHFEQLVMLKLEYSLQQHILKSEPYNDQHDTYIRMACKSVKCSIFSKVKILHNSTYMKYLQQSNSWRHDAGWWLPGFEAGRNGEMGLLFNGQSISFRRGKKFWK